MEDKKKLGEILLEAGVIDKFQLKSALAEQNKWGGRLGNHLVQMGILTEELLVKALSKQLKIPYLDLSQMTIGKETLDLVPQELAEKFHLVPVAVKKIANKKTLIVAMSDPTNLDAIDELQFRTGHIIKPAVDGDTAIEMAIRRYYYGETGPQRAPHAPIDFDPSANAGPMPASNAPTADVHSPPESTFSFEQESTVPDGGPLVQEASLADLGTALPEPVMVQAAVQPMAIPGPAIAAMPVGLPPVSEEPPAWNPEPYAPPIEADAPVAAYVEPAPVYEEPAPVYEEAAPVYAEPEAVYAEPAPAYADGGVAAESAEATVSDLVTEAPAWGEPAADAGSEPVNGEWSDAAAPHAEPAVADPAAETWSEQAVLTETWNGDPNAVDGTMPAGDESAPVAEAAPPHAEASAPLAEAYEPPVESAVPSAEPVPAWSEPDAAEAPAWGATADPVSDPPYAEPYAEPSIEPSIEISAETSAPPADAPPVDPGPAEAAVAAAEAAPAWTSGDSVRTGLGEEGVEPYETTVPGEPTHAGEEAYAPLAAESPDAIAAVAIETPAPAVDSGMLETAAPLAEDPFASIPFETLEGRAVRALCGLLVEKGLLTSEEISARLKEYQGGGGAASS
jgi:type IV pilus assembly protein PilB